MMTASQENPKVDEGRGIYRRGDYQEALAASPAMAERLEVATAKNATMVKASLGSPSPCGS
jgi:hypothetical protein